jgi:hypothetical protein
MSGTGCCWGGPLRALRPRWGGGFGVLPELLLLLRKTGMLRVREA